MAKKNAKAKIGFSVNRGVKSISILRAKNRGNLAIVATGH